MGVFVLTRSPMAGIVDGLDRIALLRRLASRLEQRCERFLRAEYGLSWPQFQVLQELSVEGPVMLQQVNNAVYCTRGNLAAIVDRLERDGWVVRLRRQGDRRVVLLGLTEKGAQVRSIGTRLAAEMTAWLSEQPEMAEPILRDLSDLLRHLVDPLAVSQVAAARTEVEPLTSAAALSTDWIASDA